MAVGRSWASCGRPTRSSTAAAATPTRPSSRSSWPRSPPPASRSRRCSPRHGPTRPEPDALRRLAAAFPDLDVVPVSIIDEASLDAFRAAVWRLTGLLRVRLRKDGTVDEEPLALHPGATVTDVADWVHHDLGASFTAARVWGTSARFDGQRVGRDHVVADNDIVEIVS